MEFIIAAVVLTAIIAIVMNVLDERSEEARYAAKVELLKDKAVRRSYYPKGVSVRAYRKEA